MKKIFGLIGLFFAVAAYAATPPHMPFNNASGSGPSAPPTFIANGTDSTSTPGLPAGYQAGDLLILAVSALNISPSNSNAPVISTSGYTSLANCTSPLIDDGVNYLHGSLYIFYKIATGSETPPTVSATPGTVRYGVISAYRGVSGSTPLEATNATSDITDASSPYDIPYYQLTTLGPYRAVLQYFTTIYSNTFTPGSGWTQRINLTGVNGPLAMDQYDMVSAGLSPAGDMTYGTIFYGCRIATAVVPQ